MNAKLILILLMLSLLAAPALGAIGENSTEQLAPDIVGQINQSDRFVTPMEESLWLQMRTLLLEQVFWTRITMTSIIQGSEDKGPVLNRLMRNYEDMTEALAPYLGNETANKFGDLMDKHLQITVDLITAANDNNQTAYEAANKSLFESANNIAAFENATIPKLAIEENDNLWRGYADLTINEATELIDGNYSASIDTLDVIEEQAALIADSLTNGIIQQYPEMFH